MQILDENSQVYFNFINSLDSNITKKCYRFCLLKFLNHWKLDLISFLNLPQQDISDLLLKFLVGQKISRQYKNMIFSSVKHVCEMNDIILNWKKVKKFVNTEKTDNQIHGKDRGYTHEEIQKILNFSEQRIKAVFLILASTGIRAGVLRSLRVGDLEKINNLYKITVYSGDKEEYFTFCTPETAKEIDVYLDFRKRHGEKINANSYLIVKKFDVDLMGEKITGKQFSPTAIQGMLGDWIINSGIREIDHVNQFKRKEVPRLHGFRKFFTTQLINAKVNPEIREMLLGHRIGLASCYYRPTVEEMFEEYSKAIDNLTIDPANRLQRKVETLTIEKSRLDNLESKIQQLQEKTFGKIK